MRSRYLNALRRYWDELAASRQITALNAMANYTGMTGWPTSKIRQWCERHGVEPDA